MPASPRMVAAALAALVFLPGLSNAASPQGRWRGQDGHDEVGQSPAPGGNGVQDVHIALTGLPPRSAIAFAAVKGLGGDEWHYQGTGSTFRAAIVRPPNSTSADLYIDPCRREVGRGFQVVLRFDDGQTAEFWVQGGKADPNLRVAAAALKARWVGQDGRDLTGPGPAVGPDGIQDVHLVLEHLSPTVEARSFLVEAPGDSRWEAGLNARGLDNAEVIRDGKVPTQADLFFNPRHDLKGKKLKVTVSYGDGKTDSASLAGSHCDPKLRMPAPRLPRVTWLKTTARWEAEARSSPPTVRVALEGLPASKTVLAAELTDHARASWVFRGREGLAFDTTPYAGALEWKPGSSGRASLAFSPVRDESGSSLTLRLLLERGETLITEIPGGPLPPAGPEASRAAAQEVRPGDDVQAVVNRAPAVVLAPGNYHLTKPLVLSRPIMLTGKPGAVLTFSQAQDEPPWTAAIKIHAGPTMLKGFAVRFAGPVRWNQDVSYGPAVIGTTDNRDQGQGQPDPKAGLRFEGLDITGPPATKAGAWEEAPRLMRLVTAQSGALVGNTLRGGMIEFRGGPWTIRDNHYTGTPEGTFTPAVLSGHGTHDLVVENNRAQPVGPAGKTWRFLVLTQHGFHDVVKRNTIVGIGPRDDDTIPSMNAPEIILTESYRLCFEGVPAAVSAEGKLVRVPRLQGDRPQAGDALAILSGPHAGQWRLITQALDATTYLVDRPLPKGDFAIAIAPGFINETFEGNTIDARGGTVAANLVLAGNHFGTRVVGNHFLGGGAFRIMAPATEQPVHWGWSHAPFLGGVIEGNTVEDSPRGGSLVVEHSPAIKSSRGRVYFSATFERNAAVWTKEFLSTRHDDRPLRAWTVGDPGALDPGELVLTDDGNQLRAPAAAPSAGPVRIEGAVVNGRAERGRDLALPAAAGAVSAGRREPPQRAGGGAAGSVR